MMRTAQLGISHKAIALLVLLLTFQDSLVTSFSSRVARCARSNDITSGHSFGFGIGGTQHRRHHQDTTPTMWSKTDGSGDDDATAKNDDQPKSPDEIQRELNAITAPPEEGTPMLSGFNPDNFDKSKVPIPLFTGIIILMGSTYLTGYLLYYGIFGFPDQGELPPLF